MEQLGGLVRKLPYTAFFFLCGAIAIAGLPPFNGFISKAVMSSTSRSMSDCTRSASIMAKVLSSRRTYFRPSRKQRSISVRLTPTPSASQLTLTLSQSTPLDTRALAASGVARTLVPTSSWGT